MMYFPSCSADGEFIFHHNPGELCDAKEVLAGFPGWEDFRNLPYSEKQGQKRPGAKKAEDPRTKSGAIGAFCRAYDIQAAIEKFIPDTYIPGDDHWGKPRYTYTYGSTSNGAVVEDDGRFLYSHHTSDPCSDRLVNPFDLVRIHKFGHLDEGVKDDAKPSSLPSFKAMLEFIADDEAFLAEFATNIEDLFDDESEGTEVPGDEQGTEVPPSSILTSKT